MLCVRSAESQKILLRYFQTHGIPHIYRKNQLISGGDSSDHKFIHFIQSGYVKITPVLEDEYIYLFYGKNDIFSLLSMVNVPEINLRYTAVGRVRVYSVPAAQMQYVVANDIGMAHAMIEQLYSTTLVLSSVIENLRYRKASDRLIYGLLLVAVRFGRVDGNRAMLDSIFTQTLLGYRTNIARETVSREFEKLRSKQLIDTTGSQIVITDLAALHAEINNPFGPGFWSLMQN